MAPFEINETVKICDPKKPGDFRIISKSVYDKNPEGYELFSQYKPKGKAPEEIEEKKPTELHQPIPIAEFERTVEGMSDDELKATAEGYDIEEGDWSREEMITFIVDQESKSRLRKVYEAMSLNELKVIGKEKGLTGWANSKHETLVEKIMEAQFPEETE